MQSSLQAIKEENNDIKKAVHYKLAAIFYQNEPTTFLKKIFYKNESITFVNYENLSAELKNIVKYLYEHKKMSAITKSVFNGWIESADITKLCNVVKSLMLDKELLPLKMSLLLEKLMEKVKNIEQTPEKYQLKEELLEVKDHSKKASFEIEFSRKLK